MSAIQLLVLLTSAISLTTLGCSKTTTSSSASPSPGSSPIATVAASQTPPVSSSPIPSPTTAQPAPTETPTQSIERSLQVPKLKKGMSYDQARQRILEAGWQPITTTPDTPDGTNTWRKRGYNEVTACSGTGMGFCRFEFAGVGNRKLIVVTGGQESTVQRWWDEEAKEAAKEQASLPFVGTRRFNFLGGSGTGYTIAIDKDGNTVFELQGTMQREVLYRGRFRQQIPLAGAGSITIQNGMVYRFVQVTEADKQKCQQDAAEGNPCMTELTE